MSIIDNFNFTHPLDTQALNALKAIPGFTKVTKAYMRLVSDRQFHLNNMSSKVLLGPNQMPEIYELLPPVCERLGIEVPPLYLELDPGPNAYTRGDNLPEITLTSGLIEHMTREEIQVVMAHECGHIICHHMLYTQIGLVVLSGTTAALDFPVVGQALRYAFLTWMRSSEFSADRAAGLFCGNSKDVALMMMRFAGWPKSAEASADIEGFMQQAAAYDMYMNDSGWNKFLGTMAYLESDHPLNAVRAREITKWMEFPEVQKVVDDLDSGVFKPAVTHFNGQVAAGGPQGQPVMGQPVMGQPTAGGFCQNCGAPLAAGMAFCGGCGSPVAAPAPMVFCSSCGAQNEAAAAFCQQCGQPLASAGDVSPRSGTSTDKIRDSLKAAQQRG